MSNLVSVQAIVHGRVQGVLFRSFASRNASELGLMGYTRNLRNGTVEVVAEGEREQLEKLIDQLKIGPPVAKVEKVITSWSEYTGKYSDFAVLHSEY